MAKAARKPIRKSNVVLFPDAGRSIPKSPMPCLAHLSDKVVPILFAPSVTLTVEVSKRDWIRFLLFQEGKLV